MISVVIPTCDRPIALLCNAVESALSQSLKPLEVIVIDNGATAVDSNRLPEQIRYHRIAARVGPSKARNTGAALAQGAYLAFLDDDDFWDPDFLNEAWSALQSTKADCVFGRIDALSNGVRRIHREPSPQDITIDRLLLENPGTGGINLLISRQMFERVSGYDERLRISEDRAIAIEIILAGGKITTANKAVAIMREHDLARLRYSDLHRFPFVWKYRKLMGWRTFIERNMWVLAKAIRRRIRNT